MSYKAEISRDNPSCFLFLVDQSRSMEDEVSIGEDTQSLATGVADSINRWLQELSIKCAKSEGIRDYYNVGVFGYGKDVGPSFVGTIAGRELIPISEIAENPARLDERTKMVPDGAGGLVEQSIRKPVWFDPIANGGTPMCKAAGEAQRVLEGWIAEHPDSFPPTCIHITDGEATDGNPTDRLIALKSLSTSDGNAMLFNIHLSANPKATPVLFPDSPDDLPDEYSKMLFETASPLTPSMRALAREHGFDTSEDSRCFVLNADLVLLVQAIDIGTRPSNVQMEGPQETEAVAAEETPDTTSEAEETDDEKPEEPDTTSEAEEADDEKPEEPDTTSEAEEADDEKAEEPDTTSEAEEADDEKPEEPDTTSEAEEADDEQPEESDTTSEAEEADDEEPEETELAWSGSDQEPR